MPPVRRSDAPFEKTFGYLCEQKWQPLEVASKDRASSQAQGRADVSLEDKRGRGFVLGGRASQEANKIMFWGLCIPFSTIIG